ncbi:hypothetical protein BDV19DRAFT_229838 [Aspergillus venezuelensis]
MTGEEDPKKQHPPSSPESSRQWPDDENPFVAFRRFADEQFSSMLQAVIGIPSSIGQPNHERWSIFDEQSYRDAQAQNQRRQREDYTGDGENNAEDQNSTQDNSNNNNSNNVNNNSNNPPSSSNQRSSLPDSDLSSDIDMFFDSFFDRFWLGNSVSSMLSYPYQNPLLSTMTSSQSPIWPVNYLMFSPYSPLHLERAARYRSRREQGIFSSLMSSMSLSSEAELDPDEPKWREAFEDLLRLENGKPMLVREPGTVIRRESGKDWLQGLAQRGSLGCQWKFASGSDAHPWTSIIFDSSRGAEKGQNSRALPGPEQQKDKEKRDIYEDDANTEPQTVSEMDLYEQFLSGIDAREREIVSDLNRSPLLRTLLEDRRRDRSGDLHPKEHSDDTETWLELVSGGNRQSVPDAKSAEVLPPAEAITQTDKTPDAYVVSTQTSTNRVRLPDGSMQTKTVKTRRFSDGREETQSSTEVSYPQRDGSRDDDKKSGWFWKD